MDDLDATQTHSGILATGNFPARLVRVLIEEEMGGVTYSAIYTQTAKKP
jgi:hypothetical protein